MRVVLLFIVAFCLQAQAEQPPKYRTIIGEDGKPLAIIDNKAGSVEFKTSEEEAFLLVVNSFDRLQAQCQQELQALRSPLPKDKKAAAKKEEPKKPDEKK